MSEELYLVKTLKPLKPCMGAKAKGFKVLKVLTESDIHTGRCTGWVKDGGVFSRRWRMSEELYLVKTLKPLKPCGKITLGFKVLKVLTEMGGDAPGIREPGVKTPGWEEHEVPAGLTMKTKRRTA